MQHTFRTVSFTFGAAALLALGFMALSAQRTNAAETTFTAAARTCPEGKKWRYIDNDQDRLGNPSKRKRICREFPREGYVTNRLDSDDSVAQFGYKGQRRGWIRINLRDADKSYYRFRAFSTPRTRKKVKVVRYEKLGAKRNRLVALHPRGKRIKFIDYANGFTWHSKKLSSKKWKGRFVGLEDFNNDDKPEVVVVLKRGSVVRVKVIRFVSGKGFTKVADVKLTDGADVKPKNTQLTGNTWNGTEWTNEGEVILFNDIGPEYFLGFDGDEFAFIEDEIIPAFSK